MLCWAVSRRDRTRETRCQGLGGVWRKGSREAVSRMRHTSGAGAEARGGLESGDEDSCCPRLALSTCEVCANAGALIMAAARTPITSNVCVSVAIRLLERIIISLIVLELPRR